MKYSFPLMVMLSGVLIAGAADPVPVSLKLVDQFEKPQDLRDYRGDVVVFLFGDRHATDANRKLGERLFVQFHPTAKGLTPAEARKAPPTALEGLSRGQRSPDVKVIPVACTGQVPELVLTFLRKELKRASPDVPVWIDSNNVMKTTFGLQEQEPNLVIIDGQGRMRFRAQGELDAKSYDRVVEVVDFLRKESAGLTK